MTVSQDDGAPAGREPGGARTRRNPFHVERFGPATPYVWYGMRFGTWARLLAAGRFDVTLNCLPRVLGVSLVAPLNSAVHHATQAVLGRRIAATPVRPPVFIIGHWRTGTTLLHEILDRDPRLAAPATFDCMFPDSFVALRGLALAVAKRLQPATRPFDDMVFGADRPQEDEFALLNSGAGSPYLTLAFPRQGAAGGRYADPGGLPPREREAWERAYLGLVRRFQYVAGARLVLKSPWHAARIPTLLKLFPDARFVFTARDPSEVFVSHLRTLKVLAANQGLHNPLPADDGWIRNYVLDVFADLFAAYERDRRAIPAGRLAELRYEDLVADPMARLAGLYRDLDLGAFAPAEAPFRAYLDERKGHRRNVNRIAPADRALIAGRWGSYFDRFGYAATVA